MRDQVVWQRATLVPDGAGGSTKLWTTLGQPWCAARPTGGSQGATGGVVQDEQRWILEMRPCAILTSDRIVFGGVRHVVRNVIDPDRMNERILVTIELEVPSNDDE